MFVTGTDDAFQTECEQLFPPRRVGLPEEVAAAVFFLASEEARFVNGVLFPVDGGILRAHGAAAAGQGAGVGRERRGSPFIGAGRP